jgi:hypothetical protein
MKKAFLVVLVIISGVLNAQFCKRDNLEKKCHYPIENKEEIFKKVDTFLWLMSKKDSTYKKWIDTNDLKNWVTPFDEISDYLKYPDYNKATIVGIIDIEPNKYVIKILLNNYKDTISSSFIGVYNLILNYNINENRYFFSDYRNYYIETYLEKHQEGHILYYCKNTFKLNKEKCKAFDEFNNEIARKLNTPPKNIIYFSLRNSTELLNIFGWDIVYNMFYAPKAGFARFGGEKTMFENIIYSGNDSERYDHELIHLYYNEILGSDSFKSTFIIGEGLPTYFGGSSGKTFDEIKANLRNYLAKTDSTKIQNHFISRRVNIQIDKNTNYIYAMGAFITELYYKKEGLNGLKKLVRYDNDNFIENVSKFLNCKIEDIDKHLRKLIKL